MKTTKVKKVEAYKDGQGEHLVCKGKLIMIDGVKGVIVSETEEPESNEEDFFGSKILVRPEQLSAKHLQAILNGKLKNGDEVYVECDNDLLNKKGGCTAYELSEEWDKGVVPDSFIRLTNNHVKLFPIKNNEQLWDNIFNKYKTYGAYELKELLKKHFYAPEEIKENEHV